MLNGHGDRGIPLKREPSGKHLIENDAGGIDIAARVDPAAPRLLRRDIVDGAQRLLRQRILSSGSQPGDPEVSHLDAAVPEDHDVLGLDIPVYDASAVGMGQGLHDLGNEMECLPPIEGRTLRLHILLESNAVDKFHHDIFHVGGTAHVINGHDIGMGQHRHSLGLIVEPAAELSVLC